MKISTIKNNQNRIVGILLWLILWQLAYWIINEDIYFPSPISVASSMLSLILNYDSYIIIASTTLRVLISFSISAVLGISLGYICGINKKVYEIFEPLIIIVRSTPIISIIIIAIIWFKTSNVPIFTGVLMCFPIIFSNMLEIFKKVYFKSSLPYLSAGFSTALGISWKVIAAAEALSFPKYGIGTMLIDSKNFLQVSNLLAWTVIIIILSYLFEFFCKKLFSRIE